MCRTAKPASNASWALDVCGSSACIQVLIPDLHTHTHTHTHFYLQTHTYMAHRKAQLHKYRLSGS